MSDRDRPKAVAVEGPLGPAVPVVFDSPHSGTHYPEDFRHAVDPFLLRGGEDRFVDDLVADAPRHGATLVRALFTRTYIDPNRALEDLDAAMLDGEWDGDLEPGVHSQRGVGLIFRLIGNAVPIYARALEVDEVRRRIDDFWIPYHDRLAETLDRLRARHGRVWHVNCHSMQSVGSVLSPDPGRARPDFVLGDLYGRSCAQEFTDFVACVLRDLGYSVGINDPFPGALIVERYGRPEDGCHSLQIEINRGLYMDEETLEAKDGFDEIRADLTRLAERLCHFAAERARKSARHS